MPRPKSPLLSRDKVVKAALDLIDQRGVGKLTMSALATSLGVHHSSLYHYHSDRDALLHDVVESLFEDVEAPPVQSDIVEWFVGGARVYYRALVEHPNVLPLLTSRFHWNQHLVYHSALTELTRQGVAPADARLIAEAAEAMIVGYLSVNVESHGPHGGAKSPLDRFLYVYRAALTTLVAELTDKQRSPGARR